MENINNLKETVERRIGSIVDELVKMKQMYGLHRLDDAVSALNDIREDLSTEITQQK